MRVSQLLVACGAFLTTYLALHLMLSLGPESEFSRLQGHADRLRTNVDSLEALHDELVANSVLYERDPRAAELLARDLMFVQEDDRVIRIVGRPDRPDMVSPGSVVRTTVPPIDHRLTSVIAATIVLLVTLFLQVIISESGNARDHRTRRASR